MKCPQFRRKSFDGIPKGQNVLKIPIDRRERFLDELDKEENGDEGGEVKRGRKKKNIDILDQLFDICTCKHISRDECNCPAARKVAPVFLFDGPKVREENVHLLHG